MENMLIKVIADDEANRIVEFYDKWADDKGLKWPEEYLGLFLCEEEDGTWTAIDNRDGNAWVEEFKNRSVAEMWLRDECDADEAQALDIIGITEDTKDEMDSDGESLAEKMLIHLCSWLSGQGRMLEGEVIPILHIKYGYHPKHFKELGICSAREAAEYIAEYKEYQENN